GVDVAELVATHAVPGPDGVRFLQLGKLPGRVKPGSTTAFRAVLEQFRTEGWTMVGDLAAGTRQPFFGWSDFAEVVLIVVEPSAKSLLSARRLAKLAHRPAEEQAVDAVEPQPIVGIVASKMRATGDVQRIQHMLAEQRLPLLATVPFDEQVAAAERLGRAPIDAAPTAPAMVAIQELAERLEQMVTAHRQNRSL
nr:hypothetical protein [Chloroflexota bacterium]